MKAIKIYLIIVSLLLLCALGGVVYVWSLYQGVQDDVKVGMSVSTNGDSNLQNSDSDAPPTTMGTPGTEMVSEGVSTSDTESVDQTAPMSIDATTLSQSQRAILETFGFEGDTIVVSDALISCAQEAVGEERFLEIVNGSAPSPLEALVLVPCAKQ